MKTHGNDPVHGCTHGATTDISLQGLTKREWLFGCALQGYGGVDVDPEKIVDWALKCVEIGIKKLNQAKVTVTDAVSPES